LLPTFLNRLAPMDLKIKQERLEESLVEQVTCVMPVAVRVSRNPSLESHVALHVDRVVLNMNKYLMSMQKKAGKPEPSESEEWRDCALLCVVGEHTAQQLSGRGACRRLPKWRETACGSAKMARSPRLATLAVMAHARQGLALCLSSCQMPRRGRAELGAKRMPPCSKTTASWPRRFGQRLRAIIESPAGCHRPGQVPVCHTCDRR